MAAAPASWAMGLTFTDSEFMDSDWTHEVIVDIAHGSGTPSTSTWSVQQANGDHLDGNFQNGAMSLSHRCLFLAHFLDIATMNPADVGGIISLHTTGFFKIIDGGGTCTGSGDPAAAVHMVLEQGGRYYVSSGQTIAHSQGETWVEWWGQTADDFDRFNDNACTTSQYDHPDFSVDGEPIRFGYATGMTTTNSLCEATWGIDNITIGEFSTATGQQSWSAIKSAY